MNFSVKAIALKAAVIMFFVMCFIGHYRKHESDVCCQRALIGALIVYALIAFTGKMIFSFIVDVLAKEKTQQMQANENSDQEFKG